MEIGGNVHGSRSNGSWYTFMEVLWKQLEVCDTRGNRWKYTGAFTAWSAQDRLPRLAILGPPMFLPPTRFSRTTTTPANWMMPGSAHCLPDVKASFHRGRAQPAARAPNSC